MKNIIVVLGVIVFFMLPSCYTNVIESEDFVTDPNNSDSVPSSGNNEEGIDYLADALPFLFETLSECENISDADKQLQQIKEFQGVEDAWTEGEELYVAIKGWETMGFTFPHEEDTSEEMDDESSQTKTLVKAMENRMDAAVRPEGKTLKAVIANQQYYDQRCKQHIEDYTRLEEQLKSCGIETKTINNPGISFFANDIYGYDLVFLVTHGGYTAKYGSHILLTGDELCKVPKKRWYQFFRKDEKVVKNERSDQMKAFLAALREKYNATEDHIRGDWAVEIRDGDTCWVFRPFITEKFISEKVEKKFQNPYSIFFNTACKSLKVNNALADAFFTKGLGVYLGYDESNGVGKKAGPAFFESLLTGFSVEKAYNELPAKYRSEFHQYDNRVDQKCEYYWANLKYLINPAAQKDKDIFLFQTITAKKEPEDLEKYVLDLEGSATSIKPDSLSFGILIGNDKSNLRAFETKRIENMSKGELVFRDRFYGFQIGKTYYYCAYTYDGNSYNCGDTLSFTIYNYSFCPNEKHPHAIDLGLPSGTMWACCNVGASSPDAFGGYYAWGEVEEKESYSWDSYTLFDDEKGQMSFIGDDIAGSRYDVASVEWGASWCMPSKDQITELKDRCLLLKWISYGGKNGLVMIGPNWNTLFLPAAGHRSYDYLSFEGTNGYYWSSSQRDLYDAYFILFSSDYITYNFSTRTNGLPVRPVCQ